MTNYPDEDVISSKVHWSEAHGVRATACICQFNPDHSHLFIRLLTTKLTDTPLIIVYSRHTQSHYHHKDASTGLK